MANASTNAEYVAEDHFGLTKTFLQFYSNLSLANLTQIGNLYSQGIVFIDPVGSHSGLPSLTEYFKRLLNACSSCTCQVHSYY